MFMKLVAFAQKYTNCAKSVQKSCVISKIDIPLQPFCGEYSKKYVKLTTFI